MRPKIAAGKDNRTGAANGGGNGIDRHHSSLHMIFYMTMEHPRAGIVGDHVHGPHASRKKFHHIGMPARIGDGFPVPMRRVQVNLIPHSQQIPAYLLPLFHRQARKIAKYETINGIKLSLRFAPHLVEDHESCNKFAVDILRRPIGLGFAFRGNDDWAQQAGVDLVGGIHMAVIPPHDRTRLPRAGSATFVSKPVVSKTSSWRDPVALSEWNIERAFTILVVTQAVRMHVVGSLPAIQKFDDHLVANFRPDDWPENSQPQ